ncbi:MAG: DUF523 domain-containing protein [Cytophagales bacterium]|nr:DUF523 domain-containing protein [Cytophagales bacterium]
MKKILVSACLAGYKCRYDGKAQPVSRIECWLKEGIAVPVCPEEMGGLPTPRIPSEIQTCSDGTRKVVNKAGNDVTKEFEKGAQLALETAQKHKITQAVLKAKSPSCGCGKVYDGSFQGSLTNGNGITADLLLENGIEVFTESNFPEGL